MALEKLDNVALAFVDTDIEVYLVDGAQLDVKAIKDELKKLGKYGKVMDMDFAKIEKPLL